jgi:hypothetical protein
MATNQKLLGGRKLKDCASGFVRNNSTKRCVKKENLKINSVTGSMKVKRNRKANTHRRKKSVDSFIEDDDDSLKEEQRADFDKMLHVMRQPVMKRPGQAGPGASCKPEPCDVQACLTSASVAMLRAEMTRRGYKVASPVVNVLVPRKKGDPRP